MIEKIEDFMDSVKEKFPVLYYIKTFLAFFSLLAMVCFFTKTLDVLRTISIISGAVVSIRLIWQLLKGSVTTCGAAGMRVSQAIGAVLGAITLIPILSTILAYMFAIILSPLGYIVGVAFGVAICGFLVLVLPFGVAMVEYFTINERPKNKKLEFIVAAIAVILSIALPIGSYFVERADIKAEAPAIQAQLNEEALYKKYITENPEKHNDEYIIDISNPTTSVYDIETKHQTDTYVFMKEVNNINYEYEVVIHYSYVDSGWELTNITESKKAKSYMIDITGTYVGEGRFFGNLVGKNEFTFVFDELNENGGSGYFKIYYPDTIDETIPFTVQVVDNSDKGGNIILQLKLSLEKPLTYKDFVGADTDINELEMTYYMITDAFETYSFSSNLLTLTKE